MSVAVTLQSGDFERKRDREDPASGPDVERARSLRSTQRVDCRLRNVLRFRTRNEHALVDVEFTSVKSGEMR